MDPETAARITDLQGAAVFLYGLLVTVALAWRLGPSEKPCSPDCNHCPAWRREQEAKQRAERAYAICAVCWKRHAPSDPHR